MTEKYVKVPIFPLTKFLSPAERHALPTPMKPVSFQFGDQAVSVDEVLECGRGASRRVGGRGFRFTCRVSWTARGRHRQKQSVLWFDDFLGEWFVEVPETRVPVDWDTATQISDIGPYYDDGEHSY